MDIISELRKNEYRNYPFLEDRSPALLGDFEVSIPTSLFLEFRLTDYTAYMYVESEEPESSSSSSSSSLPGSSSSSSSSSSAPEYAIDSPAPEEHGYPVPELHLYMVEVDDSGEYTEYTFTFMRTEYSTGDEYEYSITLSNTANLSYPYEHRESHTEYDIMAIFGSDPGEVFGTSSAIFDSLDTDTGQYALLEPSTVISLGSLRVESITGDEGETHGSEPSTLSDGSIYFERGYNMIPEIRPATGRLILRGAPGIGEGYDCEPVDSAFDCQSALKQINGRNADANGNIVIEGGKGWSVQTDKDNHSITLLTELPVGLIPGLEDIDL